MKEFERVKGGYLVSDDTSIYEIDMDCYSCLSEEEKEAYFDEQERELSD